jgi:hypothetical protein
MVVRITGDGTITGLSALPAQTGQGGNYLTTDGTDASWAPVAGGSGVAAAGEFLANFVPTDPADLALSASIFNAVDLPDGSVIACIDYYTVDGNGEYAVIVKVDDTGAVVWMTALQDATLGVWPDTLAASPDGQHVYMSMVISGSMSMHLARINVATGAAEWIKRVEHATLTVGVRPMAVSPDGIVAIAVKPAGAVSSDLYVFDVDGSVLLTTAFSGLTSSSHQVVPAFGPDGALYVSVFDSSFTPDRVMVSRLDYGRATATLTEIVSYEGDNPGVLIADTDRLYAISVTSVVCIDIATGDVKWKVTSGAEPGYYAAPTPDGSGGIIWGSSIKIAHLNGAGQKVWERTLQDYDDAAGTTLVNSFGISNISRSLHTGQLLMVAGQGAVAWLPVIFRFDPTADITAPLYGGVSYAHITKTATLAFTTAAAPTIVASGLGLAAITTTVGPSAHTVFPMTGEATITAAVWTVTP